MKRCRPRSLESFFCSQRTNKASERRRRALAVSLGGGFLDHRDWASVALCGSFGRACVHEYTTLGKISVLTARMSGSKAEASHVSDLQRQCSLALRCLRTCLSDPRRRRSLLHYLLLSPWMRLSAEERSRLVSMRADVSLWDAEFVRGLIECQGT